jgi:hypothetical protein
MWNGATYPKHFYNSLKISKAGRGQACSGAARKRKLQPQKLAGKRLGTALIFCYKLQAQTWLMLYHYNLKTD